MFLLRRDARGEMLGGPQRKWRVRHRETDDVATATRMNLHGIGEFIALYDDGDMSSEMCRDYEPLDFTWAELERKTVP